MTATRTKALSALRDGRVAVLAADRSVLAPRIAGPLRVTAFVTSSRSDNPDEPTGYFVDLAGEHWSCTCREAGDCAHIAAVALVTAHPSAAAKGNET